MVTQNTNLKFEKALSPNSPIALSPSNNKKLDCFANARNDKSRTTHIVKNLFTSKKVAFTLAEVLITIGVIGVVAAITLVPLIHKYKIKQYETRFKKCSANLQNAINLALADSGYQKITDITGACASQGNRAQEPCKSDSMREFNQFWEKVLGNLHVVKIQTSIPGTTVNQGNNVKTVSGVEGRERYLAMEGYRGGFAILSDGSNVTYRPTLHYHNNGDYYYAFDTNGYEKGPNRVGYDIFVIANKAGGCDINSTTNRLLWDGTSGGCYNYALKNQSLNSTAKNYWESLK